MSEKALFYKILAILLERPENPHYSIDSSLIPPLNPELTRLRRILTTKKPDLSEYDSTIGGLPGACSLGLNIQNPAFLASLKAYYEAHGFKLSETVPVDYLPAILEFLYWVFLNSPQKVAYKIEKEIAGRWGIGIVEQITACLREKGKQSTLYAELLELLKDYWLKLSRYEQ